MTKKRLKYRMFSFLRKLGMLCKKPIEPKKGLRIARTVYPENRVSPIDAERAIWVENKKKALKGCLFDTNTNTCKCGVKSIDDFASKKCKK
jgi:hypothetical protein